MIYRNILQSVIASLLAACAVSPPAEVSPTTHSASEPSEAGHRRFQLRVSLYPWIPEPESFAAWIESDFESKNPDIDLVVRPIAASVEGEPGFIADLAYQTDKAVAALTDPSNPDAQDLIEIDTLTLGTLAAQHAIAPFGVGGTSFLPEATEAVTWNTRSFGVPHWTCGYFLISEDPGIRRARNVHDLIARLEAEGTDRVNIAGVMEGSWDSIAIYLDAFRDTYPNRSLTDALQQSQIDPRVAGQFQELASACVKDGVNYCFDDPADLFATGGADAAFGFSERLHPILANPARTVGELHIASATLGNGDRPLAFVDALVKSARCTTDPCLSAARRFATYYISDATFESTLMGRDTVSGVPRYLLPSTSSALDFGQVGRDRLYDELKREIQGARAFPNTGVPEARMRGLIRQQMDAALFGP